MAAVHAHRARAAWAAVLVQRVFVDALRAMLARAPVAAASDEPAPEFSPQPCYAYNSEPKTGLRKRIADLKTKVKTFERELAAAHGGIHRLGDTGSA